MYNIAREGYQFSRNNTKMEEVAAPTSVREMINLKIENFCVIFSARTECLPLGGKHDFRGHTIDLDLD